MTELTLYGSRLPQPYDAIVEVVPVPSSNFDNFHAPLTDAAWQTRFNGWRALYMWTVKPVTSEDLLELVTRGVGVS